MTTTHFAKKLVISLGVVTTVLTIMGGIWAFEAHYATNERVNGVAYTAKENVEKLEFKIASVLDNQQYKSDVRYFQFMYDKLSNDLFQLKRQIEKYPDDPVLKQDYQEILELRKEVKERMDESMEKIKVNR